MSHTIVYDRLFLRCEDRYIPFCLYGSSNVTQFSYKTHKEIREREWHTFTYNDEMILGTADQIMDTVKKYHPGENRENFTFHSHWMNDAQVIIFFANGIKRAVTLEEIKKQANQSLECYIGAYVPDEDIKNYPNSERWMHEHYERLLICCPYNTGDLIQWIENAKKEKTRLLNTGKARSAYINIRCNSEEPIKAFPRSVINEPCYMYAPGMGYVENHTHDRVSFTSSADWEKAKLFQNSDEAYLTADLFPNIGAVKLIPAINLMKKKESGTVIMSIETYGKRRYIEKKTRKWVYFTHLPELAKRFRTEKEALRWYKDKIEGKVAGAGKPETETLVLQ